MSAREGRLLAASDVRGTIVRTRRAVWKFGGTSIGDVAKLQAVAKRLVAAHQQSCQVVAVLSAMGHTTDELLEMAHSLSPRPLPRELDALLSVGESISCALMAMAVHELGERAVSLSGLQAGVLTDDAHGNARLRHVNPARVVDALESGAIVLVAGYQGISAAGDVTTLGRGGSDASAIALAAALQLTECHIFTDVPGVFTADPRLVSGARRLDRLGYEEMLQLAEAGGRVLQPRAVELAAAHSVDIHVRSTFTNENGTWIRKADAMFETTRITGVAHRHHDSLYTVAGLTPAAVSASLAARGVAVGSIIREADRVRFTAPGTDTADVVAALGEIGTELEIRGDLGTVSVVSAAVGNRPEITARILSELEHRGIDPHLVTSTPSRVSCHIPSRLVKEAAEILHHAFELHVSDSTLWEEASVPALTSSVGQAGTR